jgi:hypothetical protein
MIRPGRDDRDRQHRLVAGAGDAVLLDQHGQHEGGFRERELGAHAHTWTHPERQVGEAMCRRGVAEEARGRRTGEDENTMRARLVCKFALSLIQS